MYRKEIVYDRETRDYAMYLDGELMGFGRTYHDAEVQLDQLVFELLSNGHFATATELDGGAVEMRSTCQTCQGLHHIQDCPAIRAQLLAPDLIAEAGILVNTLEEMQFDLCADYQAEGRFPPAVMAYHNRLCRILAKAERRLQRREFAELGGVDFTPIDVEYAPFGFAA